MNRAFDSALEDAQLVAIAGHSRPDGDAVGACYAMAAYLAKLGKDVAVLLEDYDSRYDDAIPGREYRYLRDYGRLAPDMFIAMDTSVPHRLGEARYVMERSKVRAVFDHHLGLQDSGVFRHVFCDTQMPSTTMLVYEFLSQRTELTELDVDIAAAVYAGLVYDTGGFRHRNTTPKSLEVAAELIRLGIDFSFIHRKVLLERPRENVGLTGLALQRVAYFDNGTIAATFLTLEDKYLFGLTADAHPGGIVDYCMNIRGIETAFYVSESRAGVFDVSLRSRLVNVAELAQEFGGGGHKAAAGCVISEAGGAEDVVRRITQRLVSALGRGQH